MLRVSVHGDALEPVDILTAGFPCQPFSVAGEKLGFQDERGLLLPDYSDHPPVRSGETEMLPFETFSNLRSHDRGKTFRRIQFEIQRAGYWFTDIDAQVCMPRYTEIPQNRERIFMVAISNDHYSTNSSGFLSLSQEKTASCHRFPRPGPQSP